MITAVVPYYNYRRFIKKRLQTILNQTRPPDEIMFLDDASNDGGGEFAAKLLEQGNIPYRIIRNEINSGSVFAQWQKGLDEAKGDYIWFAEADDAAHSFFLEEVMIPLEADPSVVLSYCDSQIIDDRNRKIWPRFYKDIHAQVQVEKWESSYVNDGADEIGRALFIKNTIPNVSGVIMRREALQACGIPIGYRGSGDWQCYINLLQRGSVAYTPRLLNYNRIHQSRITARSDSWESYFLESVSIAQKLLATREIPRESQRLYIWNWMNQARLGGLELTEERLKALDFIPAPLVRSEYDAYKKALCTPPRPLWRRVLGRLGRVKLLRPRI